MTPACLAGRSRIVYFHSVGRQAGSTRPERFREQLETALDLGFDIVGLDEILSEPQSPRSRLALTFDDGYADNLDEAAPIMAEFGVPATIFVVSGAVAETRGCSNDGHLLYRDRPMLSRADLKELACEGFVIGSHSHHHRLAAEEAAADPDRYGRELAESRQLLAEITGQPVRYFAYPNGQRGAFSDRTARLVAEAGFDAGFTTIWGDIRHFRNRMLLPRCEMPDDADRSEVRARLNGRRDIRRLKHLVTRGSRKWGRGITDE